MAKGAYIGVGNVAKKIKKGYVGIGGVAKKIKKGYIGIGGVARPFWSSGELEYYGTTTPLSIGRYNHTATSIGDYALFAGGYPENSKDDVTDSVEVYNSSLTRTDATSLSLGRDELASTSVGNYALFAGGNYVNNSGEEKSTGTVDAYSSSLTRTSPTSISTAESLAATTIGNYALFGGGYNYANSVVRADVYAYDTSLTQQSTVPDLFFHVYYLAASSNGNYALFAGGKYQNKSKSYVSAYDNSLTYTRATDLSKERSRLAGASVGNYALFAGGYRADGDNDYIYSTVDAYDESLTRTTISGLPTASYHLCGVSANNYAIFAGGVDNNNVTYRNFLSDVTSYNESLTRTILTPLSEARLLLAGTTVGNYVLFGGGLHGEAGPITVDVYMIN